jgi:probable F420-dependent oxidoreductase
MKMDLKPVGVWTHALDMQPIARSQELAAELDELGFGSILLPEMAGRDPLVFSSRLLGATPRIVIGTGIAGIYSRDALTMNGGHRALTEAFPDRFLLGMGVSHAVAVEGLRGQTYDKPLTKMREYLDAMDHAPYFAYRADVTPVRVLAALGPKMLELARTRTAGTHPYLVTPELTAKARAGIGPDGLVASEQGVVLDTDKDRARATARLHLKTYLALPNYSNNWKRQGFTDDDLADGGSDRLVDALVVWGDEATIAARVQEHRDAGADHVCIQALTDDPQAFPAEQWRALAPVLTA